MPPLPHAGRLLVCAQRAAETGLAITVCHLPPGNIWTKIEHRLFSRTTATWRGRPVDFCAECGRRMVVQVRPDGWSAKCSRHGVLDSKDLETER